jgi:hypothetical protein
METRRFLQSAFAAALWLMPLGACVTNDDASVRPCPPLEESPPVVDPAACDERELAEYTAELSDQIVDRNTRSLVRVGFDEAARATSVCVDERVGSHAWNARRDVADRLLELGSIPPGPACVAGKRIDLNRYEAKLAEAKEAQSSCGMVVGGRMKAIGSCPKFESDWILYDRVGVMRPYLYVKSEVAEPTVSASKTLSRCLRTEWGFEQQSDCIQADGFELLKPPERD